MFLFNSESVYLGYSLSDLATVRTVLSTNHIKYKVKVVNRSGQWYMFGSGSRRGAYGSFGMNSEYERLYNVMVKNADYEEAKYLVGKALSN